MISNRIIPLRIINLKHQLELHNNSYPFFYELHTQKVAVFRILFPNMQLGLGYALCELANNYLKALIIVYSGGGTIGVRKIIFLFDCCFHLTFLVMFFLRYHFSMH